MTSEAGSISSKLLMCGGGVHSIVLFPLVARCLEKIAVYMRHVCCVEVILEDSGF